MAMITQYKGMPPINILEKASRRKMFFDEEGTLKEYECRSGKLRTPNTKSLSLLLEGVDISFI